MLPLVPNYERLQAARYIDFVNHYESLGFTKDQAIVVVNQQLLLRALESIERKLK